jgi:hypothetical protein
LSDLEGLAREFRPTKVFVSHAADHNPDHRALYLFSHVALWNLEPALRPQVYAYLIHYPQWPHPKGDHPDAKLKPPARLQEMVQWSSFLLGDEEVRNKKKALQAHRSQYQYSAKSLLSFVRSNELFGEFPQIFLTTKPSPAGLFPEGSEGFLEMPDGLTDEEKTFFTEVRWQSVWTEREDIVLSLTFSRPLTERTAASVYLFGYRQGRLFQEMPKIQIRLGRLGHVVLDQKRSISREIVTIERKPREVRLRISRKAMGNPDRLLVGARTYSGEVPLDWASWRTLHLPQAD